MITLGHHAPKVWSILTMVITMQEALFIAIAAVALVVLGIGIGKLC